MVAGESWKEAFMSTIPKRKIFSAMDEDGHSDSAEENVKGENKIEEENKDKAEVFLETNPS